MADLGRLGTQYRAASRAATVIDRAAEELRAKPIGRVRDDNRDVGRYLASIAGLINPNLADQVDAELVTLVPRSVLTTFRTRERSEPDVSIRLIDTAGRLQRDQALEPEQIELVEDVAQVADQDAARLSRSILAH